MNAKINKVVDEINKTRAKIEQLQEHLSILERKQAELENTEIIRLVRSSSVAPDELADFIASIEESKKIGESAFTPKSADKAPVDITGDVKKVGVAAEE